MEPPGPALAIMTGSLWRAKAAVTEVLEFIVTVQVGDVPGTPTGPPGKGRASGGASGQGYRRPGAKVVPPGYC